MCNLCRNQFCPPSCPNYGYSEEPRSLKRVKKRGAGGLKRLDADTRRYEKILLRKCGIKRRGVKVPSEKNSEQTFAVPGKGSGK